MLQIRPACQSAPRGRTTLLLCMAFAFTNANGAPADGITAGAPCFKVFDALLFKNKPDLTSIGLTRAAVVPPDVWLPLPHSSGQIPAVSSIRIGLRAPAAVGEILVLDKEEWPVQLDVYLTLLSRVRQVGFQGPIGYYGVPPIWASPTIGAPDSSRYRAWQSENNQMQPLADAVDALFPQLYTFSDDEDAWKQYAIANVSEARRLAGGKPVYPFIWPQYDERNKTLGLKLIPGQFWALQLQTLAQYADGVVIWGGYKMPWDEQAEWWQATRQFLPARRPNCSVPNAPGGLEFRVQ
jgi:hypothetical protein